MSEEPKHDSRSLWGITKGFYYKRSAIAIKTAEDKSKVTTLVLVLMLVFSAFGGAMVSFEFATHVLFPPTSYTGVCAPPLQIVHGGCFSVVSSTDSNGKVHTNYYPAGTVCSGNETISQCEKNG